MKRLRLTQGKFALVDDDDVYEWAKDYNWYAYKHGQTYYAAKNVVGIDGNQHTVRLHNCIIGFSLNNRIADHIDGDGLNNQRYNLRFITHRDNSQNRGYHRNGKLVGAIWDKSRNGKNWKAQIYIEGKQKNLGYFDTEQEAHEAYIKALSTAKI